CRSGRTPWRRARPCSALSWPSVASSPERRGRWNGWWKGSSETHPVAVAVGVGALVAVAVGGGVTDLAQDDDARGAPVDAQRAPGAHVVVDEEHDVVAGVD